MQTFEATKLWRQIDRHAKKCNVRSAAIAYFTDNGIRIGEGDRLVVDASDASVQCRQTSRDLLRELVDAGAEVYSYPGLHAKVMVFDSVAVVGSMNSSHFSREKLQEAAILTDDPHTVQSARLFIDDLVAKSERVDENFLQHLQSLTLEKRTPWKTSHVKKRIRPRQGLRTWAVGTHELRDSELTDEDRAVIKEGLRAARRGRQKSSSGIFYFRLTAFYKMRKYAKPGELVIELRRPRENSPNPTRVYPAVPIRHVQKQGKWTWFFVEEWADVEERAITWKRFLRLAEEAGLSTASRPVFKKSVRLLSDRQLEKITADWKD